MRFIKYLLLLSIVLGSRNTYSQQKNNTMTNQEIVKKILNGFNDPAQIQESLDLLADDYKFQNPLVKLNSKSEFIALAQSIGEVLTGIEIVRLVEADEWVAAFYIFKSSIPGVESNTATEWFRLKNEIIQESILIYDASEWRKVYEQME
ncbi:nuclear transport factor 2 family protein [Fulvivirgaceae bacterium BMA12]|uniref:Nuclear transport factor 2 family protein n=1 Tax=Agaribacillus aureus TaxID=3051825 RepID=A0ABT8LBC3_9BACT|nr:nuclear transport factor 2 family protein [Fulvivirgaceae bacterium BMA12]